MRDCLRGLSRFDQFQKSLAISPNMLTRRLQALVDAGLLERRPYSQHPPRCDYIMTERGRDFRVVIAAMYDWGSRNLSDQTTRPPQHGADDYLREHDEPDEET